MDKREDTDKINKIISGWVNKRLVGIAAMIVAGAFAVTCFMYSVISDYNTKQSEKFHEIKVSIEEVKTTVSDIKTELKVNNATNTEKLGALDERVKNLEIRK